MFIEHSAVECDLGNIGTNFDLDFIDLLSYSFDIDLMVILYL